MQASEIMQQVKTMFDKHAKEHGYYDAVYKCAHDTGLSIVYMVHDPISNVKYIGSQLRWYGYGTYWGSMCATDCSAKFANQQLLKDAISTRAHTLVFDVLECLLTSDITHISELTKLEHLHQRHHNILSNVLFANASYAMVKHSYVDISNDDKQIVSSNCSTAQIKRYTKPEERHKTSAAIKLALSSKEIRAKISERTIQALSRPEVKAKHKTNNKASMSRHEVKTRMRAAQSKRFESEEQRLSLSTANIAFYANANNRLNKSIHQKQIMSTEQARLNCSVAQKNRYNSIQGRRQRILTRTNTLLSYINNEHQIIEAFSCEYLQLILSHKRGKRKYAQLRRAHYRLQSCLTELNTLKLAMHNLENINS